MHILDSISEIEVYTSNVDLDTFLNNSMMRFASIKQIEIIGEAANYVTTESKNKFTDIQWRQIVGLRHILVREYFGIDNNLVWQIIAKDIPVLKEGVLSVLSSIDK